MLHLRVCQWGLSFWDGRKDRLPLSAIHCEG